MDEGERKVKNELVAIAVVLALIIGAGFGYSGIAGNAVTRTETITTSTTLTTLQTMSVATMTETLVSTVYTAVSTTFVNRSSMPVQASPALGPIPPFTPAGPEVGISLSNVGTLPITSLVAALRLPSVITASSGSPFAYVFHFNVTGSNPLSPGSEAASSATLVGAGFQSFTPYPLSVNGTLEGGSAFGYVQNVMIFQVAYMEPSTSDSVCTGPYGHVCFGGNLTAAAVFNCAAAAASPSGCVGKVVSPSAPQYATSVTIWFETENSYSGFSLCRYAEGSGPGNLGAYCIASNSTSFWVANAAPPPA